MSRGQDNKRQLCSGWQFIPSELLNSKGFWLNKKKERAPNLLKETSVFSYLNGCCDALAFSSQARTFPPAHGLQHLVPNITVVKAIFGGLLVIPAERRKELTSHPHCSWCTEAAAEDLSDTYTVPAS